MTAKRSRSSQATHNAAADTRFYQYFKDPLGNAALMGCFRIVARGRNLMGNCLASRQLGDMSPIRNRERAFKIRNFLNAIGIHHLKLGAVAGGRRNQQVPKMGIHVRGYGYRNYAVLQGDRSAVISDCRVAADGNQRACRLYEGGGIGRGLDAITGKYSGRTGSLLSVDLDLPRGHENSSIGTGH